MRYQIMANKITKRMVINGLLEGTYTLADDVVVAYLQNELALLDNKSKSKRESKTQKENAVIKEIILEVMQNISGTCTEISKADPRLAEYTIPKMSAMLNQLAKEGKVIKTTDKKKSIFSIA